MISPSYRLAISSACEVLPLAVGPAIKIASGFNAISLTFDEHPMDRPARVATLIANPLNPVITQELADKAAGSIGANSVYFLADGIACDIPVPIDAKIPREHILLALDDLPVDVVVQNSDDRRKKALLADMDSTLIHQECIDELAAEAGIGENVAEITARAMRGEIDFEPALRERVGLLKGQPLSIIDEVLEKRITLVPGGRELVQTMRSNGAYCLLVSGGFTHFTAVIAEKLGFHEHRANKFGVSDDQLNGEALPPILGREAKASALREIIEQEDISESDVYSGISKVRFCSMNATPNISTDRLLIRRWEDTNKDRSFFHFIMSNEVGRKYYPHRKSRAECDEQLDQLLLHYETGQTGWQIAVLKDSGKRLGFTGLHPITFDRTFAGDNEIGWQYDPDVWGNGYATEAAQALLSHAFETLKLPEIVAFAVEENKASTKVMERLNMVREPQSDFDHPMVPSTHPQLQRSAFYRITAQRWRSFQTPT